LTASGFFAGMSGSEENEKDAEASIQAIWEKLGVRPSAESRPSGRKVADVSFEEFDQYARERQWDDRQGIGYNRNCGVFAFAHSIYGSWIERGIQHQNPVTLEDIKEVDRTLYSRLTTAAVRNGGLPNWLPLPAEAGTHSISLEELQSNVAAKPEDENLWRKPRTPSKFVQRLRAGEFKISES
jgi:hypothetical protein